MSKTNLEKMGYDEINKISSDDRKKFEKDVKNAVKASLSRIKKMNDLGYDDNEYNDVYIDKLNTEFSGNYKDMSLQKLKSLAAYTKRHLSSEKSSVEGMRKQSKRSLELLARVSGINPGRITRVKGTEDFRMKGHIYKQEDIKDFWSIVRKVDENNSLQTLKGGSEDGLNEVRTMFFEQGIRDPVEVMEQIDKKYEEEQLEIAKEAEEREKRLEYVKFRE